MPSAQELTYLPPEWPMGRIAFQLKNGNAYFKQCVYRQGLEHLLQHGELDVSSLRQFINVALHRTAMHIGDLIASLFVGIERIDFVPQSSAWQNLQRPEFWAKCLVAELSTSFAPQHTQRGTGNPRSRSPDTISSFLINHDTATPRHKQVLPLANLKVYFPMVFLSNILEQARLLGFRGTQLDDADHVKYVQENYKPLASLRFEEGWASVPNYQKDHARYGINEFPLTADFFSSGMMATSLAEVIVGKRTRTKLSVEFRAPLPGTQYAENPPLNELCPGGWDLMISDPGRSCK